MDSIIQRGWYQLAAQVSYKAMTFRPPTPKLKPKVFAYIWVNGKRHEFDEDGKCTIYGRDLHVWGFGKG